MQPWRGIFGLVVTLGLAFTITASFDINTFNGTLSLWAMSMVPILVILSILWGGQYPPTEKLPQPWRGMALTSLMFGIGTLAYLILLNFRAAGVVQPFIIASLILTVVISFFLAVAWGAWPWHKMSLPAKGFLTLITAYLLGWGISYLFNFDLLSYPTGVKPSPIGAVPLYAAGGPLASFGYLAPRGPIPWESAICYALWCAVFLFIFVSLGMWPFSKSPGLTKQPVMGVVVTIACAVFAYVAYIVGVGAMNIEPIRFMLVGVSYAFGLLMIQTIFQMWPGRVIKGPVGGFVNILLSVALGFGGYYLILAFCNWHFGVAAMVYPNNWNAIAGVMLALTFPAWTVYSALWDYWPLPPTPTPPGA